MNFTPFNINHENFSNIMDMLNQYADPASAVLREYVSNGIDAVNNMNNGNVTVILPDDKHHELIIKDNGIGMSAEFMQSTLSSYANSTKKNDSKSIGEKGIGSKSAFSISDKFTIISVHDGVMTTAVNDKNEGGLQITTENTDNHNGTTVIIPVDDESVRNNIRNNASTTLCGFNSSILHVVNADGSDFKEMYYYDNDDCIIRVNDNVSIDIYKFNYINIVQGGVNYALSKDLGNALIDKIYYNDNNYNGDAYRFIKLLGGYYSSYRGYVGISIILNVAPNTLKTNPSRESIINTPANVNTIADILDSAYKTLADTTSESNDNANVNRKNTAMQTLENIVRNHINKPAFALMDWDKINRINMNIDSIINWKLYANVNANALVNASFGGHVFRSKLRIPVSDDTIIYRRKNRRAERSSYELVGTHSDSDGSKVYDYMPSDMSDNFLLIANVNNLSEVCGKIIRNRRAYCEEANILDKNNDWIIISAGNPTEHLDYWDSKRKSMFNVVDYSDYMRVMDARSERLKKERAANKGNASMVGKVTVLVDDPTHRTYKSVMVLNDVINMSNDGYMLLRANHDDFYQIANYDNQKMKLEMIVSLHQTGKLHDGKYALIKADGSKSLIKSIESVSSDINSIDYEYSMRKYINDTMSDIADADECLAQKQLFNNMISYDDDNNIFDLLRKNKGIKSSETRNLINTLADKCIIAINENNNYSKNKSSELSNRISSIRYAFRDVQWVNDAIAESSANVNINANIISIADDIDTFMVRYPMSMYAYDKYSMEDTTINNIVNYINIVDKAEGRLTEK